MSPDEQQPQGGAVEFLHVVHTVSVEHETSELLQVVHCRRLHLSQRAVVGQRHPGEGGEAGGPR